jgi:hypothetical protein
MTASASESYEPEVFHVPSLEEYEMLSQAKGLEHCRTSDKSPVAEEQTDMNFSVAEDRSEERIKKIPCRSRANRAESEGLMMLSGIQ